MVSVFLMLTLTVGVILACDSPAVTSTGPPPEPDAFESASLNCLPDNKSWERNTSDNVNLTSTTHVISEPGRHVLKFWMVDPGVVLQRLVVHRGELPASYLGPPESLYR